MEVFSLTLKQIVISAASAKKTILKCNLVMRNAAVLKENAATFREICSVFISGCPNPKQPPPFFPVYLTAGIRRHIHALTPLSFLMPAIDALICFSDFMHLF